MQIDENYYKQIEILKKEEEYTDLEELTDKFIKLMEIYGNTEDIVFELGKLYFLNNKIDLAENYLNECLKYKNKYSYIFLEKIYRIYKGNITKAIDYLQIAKEIYPNDLEIIIELIECYISINKTKEVEKIVKFLNIEEISKNNILNSTILGILRKIGLVKESTTLAKSILKKNKNIKIELELIYNYIQQKKIKKAEKYLNKILKTGSTDLDILKVSLEVYKKTENIRKLSMVVKNIMSIIKENIGYELSLVDVYLSKKLYFRAEKNLKKIIKKYPQENLKIKKILQNVYRKTKQTKKLLKIDLDLLNIKTNKDDYLLHETIDLLCKEKKFDIALKLLLDYEKQNNSPFCKEEVVYNKILENVHVNNINNKKKVVCRMVNKLLNLIPIDRLKIRNALLNEKEIAQQKIFLKSRPRKIQVVLTNRCNLRCVMCDFHKHDWNFTKKQNEELRELIPYLEQLVWQGGEVLLNEDFYDLFRLAAAKGVQQTIITNGLLINESIAEDFVKSNVLLAISIDNVSKNDYEKIRVGGNFDRLLLNLNLLNSIKEKYKFSTFNMQLSVVVMKSNYDKLEEILDFAIKYKFLSVEYNPIKLINECYEEQIFYPTSDIEKIKYINDIMPKLYKKAKKYGIKINMSIPTIKQSKKLDLFVDIYDTKNRGLNQRVFNSFYKYIKTKRQGKSAEQLFKEKWFQELKRLKFKNCLCYMPWEALMINLDGFIFPACICKGYYNSSIKDSSIIESWNSKVMRLYRYAIKNNQKQHFVCSENCISGSIPVGMRNFI